MQQQSQKQPYHFLAELADLVTRNLDSYDAMNKAMAFLDAAFQPIRVTLVLFDGEGRPQSIQGVDGATSSEAPSQSAAQSHLAVSLRVADKVVGVLNLASSEPNAFGDDAKDFARAVAGQLATLWRHKQLINTGSRRAGELSRLYQAASAIGSAYASLNHVIRMALTQFVQILPIDQALLLLWNAEAQCFVPQLVIDSNGNVLPEANPLIAKSELLQNMILQHRPLLIVPQQGSEETALLDKLGAASAVLSPLVVRSGTIGLVVLQSTHEDCAFDVHEMGKIVTLSMYTAVAIENARLFDQTKQTLSELAVLHASTLDISARLALPDLLQRLVERACSLVKAVGGIIYLLDREENVLRTAVSHVPWADYTGRTVVVGQGVSGEIALTHRPVFVNDYDSWVNRSPEYDPESDLQRAVAGVPLTAEGEIVGVMVVINTDGAPAFSQQEIDLLEMLAPQAAIAIRNAQLFAELQNQMGQLAQTQKRLVHAEKLAIVGRMVGSVTHEVNNPLQAIHNCLHVCMHESLTADKRAIYLGMAAEEVQRLMKTLGRLLEFYRPSEGTHEIVAPEALMNGVLDLTLRQLEQRHIRIRRRFEPSPPVWAVADHIRQVLLNLVLNAADAMPEGGELTVTVAPRSEVEVGVTVHDCGGGIAPEVLPLIFDPFFTTKHHGTGLGLATSLAIVEAHGGRLTVSSSSEGSYFNVILPAVASLASQAAVNKNIPFSMES